MLLDHKNERETKRVWPVHYHCRGNPCGVRSRIWSALWSEQEAGGGGGWVWQDTSGAGQPCGERGDTTETTNWTVATGVEWRRKREEMLGLGLAEPGCLLEATGPV